MKFSTPIPNSAPSWLRGILEKLMAADYSDTAGTPGLGEKWRVIESGLVSTSPTKAYCIQVKENTAWRTKAGVYANGEDVRNCYVCYRRTVSQSVPNGLIYTTIDFNAKETDTDNSVTTGTNWTMKIPKFKGGVYSVCAFVHFQDSPSPITEADLRLLKNGSIVYMMHSDSISANSEFSLAGSVNVYLAENDYFSLQVAHNAGGSRLTDINTHMAAQRINGSRP